MAAKKKTSQPLSSAKELADATGMTPSTLHYYTTLGFLRVHRRIGNKRFYDTAEAKARLQKITQLRQEGYSLSLIRQQFKEIQ